MQKIRPFEEQGNYVAMHNVIFDHIMPQVKPTSFKVLCLILRQTKGWNRDECALSFADIRRGTGIGSDHTVWSAINELVAKNYIVKKRGKSTFDGTLYGINYDLELRVKPTAENAEPTAESAVHTAAKTAVAATAESAVRTTAETAGYVQRHIKNNKNKYDDGAREESSSPKIPERQQRQRRTNPSSSDRESSHENADRDSTPRQRQTSPLLKSVLDVLGLSLRWEMGTVSARQRIDVAKIAQMLETSERTAAHVAEFGRKWALWLNKENPTPPLPWQMLDLFERVLAFEPASRQRGKDGKGGKGRRGYETREERDARILREVFGKRFGGGTDASSENDESDTWDAAAGASDVRRDGGTDFADAAGLRYAFA